MLMLCSNLSPSCYNDSTTGVSLSLRGDTIANDSFVNIDDIGNEDALLCVTDLHDCCHRSSRAGEWYFPNGTRVPISRYCYQRDDCFFRNRSTSTVCLNVVPTPLERGRCHCEVPNADGILQQIFVNMYVEMFLIICIYS